MPYDYSQLLSSENGYSDTWRDIYDESLSLPDNLLNILKKTIFLPYDFYDIVTAYFMLPSALCKVVPYLFLHGQSGSGKSTVAKVASILHGVDINSSSDTFAGIRNSLDKRRWGAVEVPSDDPKYPSFYKDVELNTCMVWDDIDPSVFANNPDLYRFLKFGYDKSTDKIILSSGETGKNLEFRCFCPKIFSSISPMHLSDRLKELRRRLIVIPCKRIEELSEERQVELGISEDDWQSKILDVTAYDWKGFKLLFDEFWDMERASVFFATKKVLRQSVKGLSSQQRIISLDLLTCGLTCGIWSDEQVAVSRLKTYWKWANQETENNAGLSQLLKQFIAQETRNAKQGNLALQLNSRQVRSQIDIWFAQGWILEKPRIRELQEIMMDLGMRLQKGKWVKG